MRILKYLVIIIHIVTVVAVMIFTLISNHAVSGKSFYKCEMSGNYFYLAEDVESFSVLYEGDRQGTVKAVYKSNQDRANTTIVDFNVAGDVYILEKCDSDYVIKKLSPEDLSITSKTKPFVLKDTEYVCDFSADLSTQTIFITAIGIGGSDARVYGLELSELLPIDSEELKTQSGELKTELSPIYRLEGTSPVISSAYFDGSNIITAEERPISENAIEPSSYAGIITLTIGQSIMVNSEVLLMYFAYAIIVLIIIILVMRLIERRRRFIDLILLNEIFILASMVLGIFLLGNTLLVILWTAIASAVNILMILFENRDIQVLCEDMERISTGTLDLEKPRGSSIETATLWRGMNEVRYLYEEYKYIRETTTAAALRFLPHNIGAMFRCNSLDEIKPGDSTSVSGTYMALRTKREVTNSLISKTEDYEKKAEGTLLTGECSSSQIRMLFAGPKSDEVELGLHYISEMEDDSACALYFRDSFKISVVGTSTKSILNIYSLQMDTMERLADWFFDLGIRLVVSEEVKELSRGMKSPLRYIGYCYIGGEKKSFYEVLDIYGERTRAARLKCLEDFDTALNLIYQNDYYLARTAFTDILKVDPTDELARWYLFICEKYLNNPELTDKPCTLDPRN